MHISHKQILIVIPARYKSSRFPGKPLAKINGIEMIRRTYDRCVLSGHPKENIVIATDSNKILKYCKNNNLKVFLTSSKCLTGTDRVAEVANKTHYNFYINMQGDEPIFNPKDINKVIDAIKKYPKNIINGYTEIKEKKLFLNRNIPKVIVSKRNELIYMSRVPIPTKGFRNKIKAHRQICIYAYSRQNLLKFIQKKKSPIEKMEDIEILRFLDIGISVKMIKLSDKSISVDVPDDINKVEKALSK